MPIFHICLNKLKTKPFFEYSSNNHNLHQLLKKLLTGLTNEKIEIKSYKDEQFIINIKNTNSIIYSCITTPEVNIEKSIAFLEEIEDFYDNNKNLDDLMNFTKKRLDYYNSEECLTKNEKILRNLNETKEIIIEDIAKLLERDNKLNEIYYKTEKMANYFNETNSFKQQLIQKKRNDEIRRKINIIYKKRKLSIFIVSGVIIVIIIYFFLTYFCGGYDLSSC